MTFLVLFSSKISSTIYAKYIGNKWEPESHPKAITRHNKNHIGSPTGWGDKGIYLFGKLFPFIFSSKFRGIEGLQFFLCYLVHWLIINCWKLFIHKNRLILLPTSPTMVNILVEIVDKCNEYIIRLLWDCLWWPISKVVSLPNFLSANFWTHGLIGNLWKREQYLTCKGKKSLKTWILIIKKAKGENSYIIDGDLLDFSACMESSKVDCFSRVAVLFLGLEKIPK